MNGIGAGSVKKVYYAPVLVVDDRVLQGENEWRDLGVAWAKWDNDLLVAHQPLIRHQEVVETILLGSAGFDFKLGGEQGVEITKAAGTVGEDAG